MTRPSYWFALLWTLESSHPPKRGNRHAHAGFATTMIPGQFTSHVTGLVVTALLVTGQTGGTLASEEVDPSASPAPAGDAVADIALRVETILGFAPVDVHLLEVPRFTLYADGLVIWSPAADPVTDADVPLLQARLEAEQTAALLETAVGIGRLRRAAVRYDLAGLADAETTVFTVRSGDLDKEVSVYALGFDDDRRAGDSRARRARAALADLAAWLADPESWLPDGVVVSAYQPRAYLGVFAEDDPERLDLAPWPWEDLSPDDLEPSVDAPFFSRAVLTPDQLERVMDASSGTGGDIVIATPDGDAAYRLLVRPLLPEEALTAAIGATP